MIKKYEYENRIILELLDKSRVSYSRIRYGDTLEQVIQQSMISNSKVWNAYNIKEKIIEILYWNQSKQKIEIILIDKEDFNLIKDLYIQTNHNGYPQSRTGGSKQFLHRIIMNSDNLIDHINRNPLDNRKSNLRFVTNSENSLNQSISKRNSSGHIGVSKSQCGNRWRARLQFKGNGREKTFDTIEEAIKQRKEWENEIKNTHYNL